MTPSDAPRRPTSPSRLLPALGAVVLAVVLLPAAALTLARLIEPWAPLRDALVLVVPFTPLALPAYAVVLVGLVVAALVRRPVRRRRSWRAAAVVATVGLVVHAAWFAPQVTGDPTDADGHELVVMNLNLLEGRAATAEVVALVEERDVDVLVLEEVPTDALARLDAAGLATLLPERAGDTRDDRLTAGTMVLSRLPLGPAEPLGTVFDSWRTTVTTEAGELDLLAVHPFAPVGDRADARRDHDLLRAAVRDDGADLVVGDLNATPDSVALRRYGDVGLRSAAEVVGAGWMPTWPQHGGWGGIWAPPLLQIDHVLVGERVRVADVGTTRVTGTDHAAVVAVLVVPW
ncbi:endonuclease/exonuclease/phosphatase family protein [Nocardioides alkalitolerans]|uniref:endonuclease/exonuclease/phosphatase family protein n=1 Tax=Nocardioides alkalitolerans TaxID=281714 RepID=UPI000428B7CD|nr:endonuclease/exonuclease/phosphatase family protein [Nocardioides alkalitolerans]